MVVLPAWTASRRTSPGWAACLALPGQLRAGPAVGRYGTGVDGPGGVARWIREPGGPGRSRTRLGCLSSWLTPVRRLVCRELRRRRGPGIRRSFGGVVRRAIAVTPGGVNSPVRAFGAVGGTPRFMAPAPGPYLTDVDGREYVDLVCSWGPMILGHAHPAVVAAVRDAVGARHVVRHARRAARSSWPRRSSPGSRRSSRSGWSPPAPRPPCRAIRLARGFTGRAKVVKFAGCYHGHVDALLAAAGSGRGHLRACPTRPASPAPRPATRSCCPTTTSTRSRAAFAAAGAEIACVITEASPGQHGRGPAAARASTRSLAEICRASTARC